MTRGTLVGVAVLAVSLIAGIAGGAAYQSTAVATAPLVAPSVTCGDPSASQLRTTLYFGTMRPNGAVSDLEWQLFLRDEVTQRFPEGLTVWEAQGQWRSPNGNVQQERSKVLLLVHPDNSKANDFVQDVIAKYRKQFDQESVLWETARVCVSM
ncbi:MAG: DUF3574 domain-containing protein [Acidimicrobiia bacterium]